jgi:hypothetical protein
MDTVPFLHGNSIENIVTWLRYSLTREAIRCYAMASDLTAGFRGNRYARNTRGTAENGVFYWARPEAIKRAWTRVAVMKSEKLVAEVGESSGTEKKGERPSLKAATKQRLVKTENTLCVLQLKWSLECVTVIVCPVIPVTNPNLVHSLIYRVTIFSVWRI